MAFLVRKTEEDRGIGHSISWMIEIKILPSICPNHHLSELSFVAEILYRGMKNFLDFQGRFSCRGCLCNLLILSYIVLTVLRIEVSSP